MTVANQASVAVTVDSSSPSYAVQAAGTSGVVVGVYKVRSTNEDFTLNKLGLTLAAGNGSYGSTSTGSGGSPSNGAGDLTQVTLWANGSQIGTATFTGNNTTATSTLTSSLNIPRDTDVLITAKANLASIGVSSSGGIGNLITVDPLNAEGTGAQSGSTVRVNATTGVAGVRLFKSYPTIALDSLNSTGVADGRLIRFKVTANSAGPVSLGQMKFTIATTSMSVTNVSLYGFNQDGTTPISGQGTSGQIGSTLINTTCTTGCSYNTGVTTLTFAPTANPVQVPAGQTYYFELQASPSSVISGSSVVTKLLGDTAYTSGLTTGYNVATSAGATSTSGDNFTWAGNSTTTPNVNTTVDWSNGYALPGLPAAGLIQTRSN
jgi:hypothetical protein